MFLLIGNGSFANRGCEAIIRGTMSVLRQEFGQDIRAAVGIYDPSPLTLDNDSDAAILSFQLNWNARRWSHSWWLKQINKVFGTSFAGIHHPLKPYLPSATAALEVGGDNYSLDYGLPIPFMNMDSFLQSRKVPLILWGASVGPFDLNPQFAEKMFIHLRKFDAIFVRESESKRYLGSNGVTHNVWQVADPAFVMECQAPDPADIELNIPEGAIGINLSPLLGRYFCEKADNHLSDSSRIMERWITFCGQAIDAICNETHRPIVLVPHVSSNHLGNDDFRFLSLVYARLPNHIRTKVICISEPLNAMQLKWIISRCSLFIGARTHSTIASLSLEIPTLSIGYSLKARGINTDIYGNLDYCMDIRNMTVALLAESILRLLSNESAIRMQLQTRIPQIKQQAILAGNILSRVLTNSL
jgi:colanic acid/amylovoran biosynthesis protein